MKIQSEVKTFLIVVLIAFVVSVGGILLLRGMTPAFVEQAPSIIQQTPPPAPSPTPQPQTLDTSTWQTYRNDEFGFEVRYPAEWQLTESKTKQSFKIPFVSEIYATEPLNFYYILPVIFSFSVELRNPEYKLEYNPRGLLPTVLISVNRFGDDAILGEVIKDLESYERVMRKYFKEGRIVNKSTLAGKPALYSKRNLGTGNESIEYLASGSGYDEEIHVFLNGYLYSIYREGAYYELYFNQILSTFRFVE